MAKSLLDDVEELGDQDLVLKVNSKYAARLEHNKRREELHRLKEKHPEVAARLGAGEGEAADTSSEDDEDDGLEPLQSDTRFLDVLAKIKQRDSAIYTSDAPLFPEASESEAEPGEEAAPRVKRQKVMSLATVNAQQVLAGGADSSEDEGGPAGGHSPTYVQEQEALRRGFLEEADTMLAAGEAGDAAFGGVLKARRGSKSAAGASQAPGTGGEARTQELLDAYFGTDEQLPEGERFLKSFIRNKGWLEKDERREEEEEGDADDDDELDEDEEYLTRADRFEASYNFRFQEPGGGNIVSYARQVEGVVRKADDRRKRARESKAARRADEAAARQEEVRRLKALKRREIEERLAEVREAAGASAGDAALARMLASGDFDAAEYDRAMNAAFGDEYYEAEDERMHAAEDGGGEAEAPADAHPPSDEAAAASRPAWAALHEELMRDRGVAGPDEGAEEGEAEAEGGGTGNGEQRAKARSVAALMSEYERLDAEDHVAGVACRFRYREVPADDFGLRTEDFLLLPDKELNQVVGLRTLAPYREEGGRRVRPNYGKLHQLQAEAGLRHAHDGTKKNKKNKNAGGGPENNPAWPRIERERVPRPPPAGDPGRTPTQPVVDGRAPGGEGSGRAAGDLAAASQPAPGEGRKQDTKRRKAEQADETPAEDAGAGGGRKKGAKRRKVEQVGQPHPDDAEGPQQERGGGIEGQSKKRRRAGEAVAKTTEKKKGPSAAPAANGKGSVADKAAARIQTFARPALRKEGTGSSGGSSKKRRRAEEEQRQQARGQAQDGTAASELTKAQRKNLWRLKKRAERRAAQS